jgi:hypothetical protein
LLCRKYFEKYFLPPGRGEMQYQLKTFGGEGVWKRKEGVKMWKKKKNEEKINK